MRQRIATVPIILSLFIALVFTGCSPDSTTATLPPAELVITAPQTLDVGESAALLATPASGSGPVVDLEWESSDATVAEVDNGIILGKSPGTVTIRASAEGYAGETHVTIREPVHEIVVMPSSLSLITGRKATLRVILKDRVGNRMDRQFTITPGDPSVVSVQDSTIIATELGSTTLEVKVGIRSVTVPLRTVAGHSDSIEVLPLIPNDLNNFGLVVGENARRAVLWRDGIVTDIHPAGLSESFAEAVNDAGRVAGRAITSSGEHVIWTWEGGVHSAMTTFSPPASVPQGATIDSVTVSDINMGGEIVGQVRFRHPTEPEQRHAFLWKRGILSWLAPHGAGPAPRHFGPPAINDSGVIAYGTYLIEGSQITSVELTNPVVSPASWGITDINNKGEFVGFQWHMNGGFSVVGTGAAATYINRVIALSSINEYSDIVGVLAVGIACSSTCRGQLVRDDIVRPLGDSQDLSYLYGSTIAINDLGQVIMARRSRDISGGNRTWLLLTPS